MGSGSPEQRDFRAYLQPVLKRWWLILAVVPVVTIGTYLYYDSKPKVYEASTEMFIQPSPLSQLLLETNSQSGPGTVENLAILLQTSAVREEAAKIIENGGKGKGGSPVPAGSIVAEQVGASSFIAIRALAPTPVGAAVLANAYAKAFVKTQTRQFRSEASETLKTAEQQLSQLNGASSGSAAEERRVGLEAKIQTLQLVSAQPGSAGIRQVEAAFPSSVPVDHNPKSNAIFAFVISLMLAIGACYGLEYMTRKVSSIEDVEEIYELPVLTEVPKVDSPAPQGDGGMAMEKMLHQPFQRLQMNLDMLSRQRPLRTILVASAAPGEGKSIVARNLALAYQEAGRHVAVLDADLRKATLGGMFDAKQGSGLADILAGRASFGQVVQEIKANPSTNGNGAFGEGVATRMTPPANNDGVGEIGMVPAGQPHQTLPTALASPEMRETLRMAAETYGTAIIDSPPILAVSDVLPLLAEADGVLLVTRLGVSTRESAQRMMAEIRRISNVNVIGVVVNGIPPRTYRTRAYGYYYG
jgi:Mrp family chromosome partitioning ATPase/capsular polysaccharide biosynthesis protein